MRSSSGGLLQAVMTLAGTMLLAACAVPGEGPRLSADTPATMGLAASAPSPQTLPIQPDWWHTLGDPQLDRVMDDALAGNPSLAGAQARLAAARAGLGEARAGLLPQITADAAVQRQRLSNQFIYPPPLGGSYVWLGNAEADLGWSLDLAGRQKALVHGAGARADAAALDAAAARVSLSGAVAQAYIALAGVEAQQRLADEQVTSRREALMLAQARVRSGIAGDLELRAAEGALASAEQARDLITGEQQAARHALAALAGRGLDYAASIAAPTLSLDTTLALPPRLGADLLGQRADVLAARARIEASSADRRAARAAFFPDIDLAAFVGAQALGLGELVSPSARTLGVGPALHLPIFEGGRLSAAYRGATADLDAAIAAYNETVVQAVREAADALAAVETAQAESARQQTVVTSRMATLALTQARIRSGLAARQELVIARDGLIAARQAQTAIAAEGAARRIRLIVALGGGFTPSPSIASLSPKASSPAAIAATPPSAQRPQP